MQMISDMKALFTQLLFTATSATVKDFETRPVGGELQPPDPGKNMCWLFSTGSASSFA